jgi:arginase
MANLSGNNKVGVLGIPLGYGAGQIGSELGPGAMRVSRLRERFLTESLTELGYKVTDHGDAAIVKPDRSASSEENPKYLGEMLRSCSAIADSLRPVLDEGEFPIILGGDHSIAIATFSTMAAFHRDKGEELGLIWFDAHADINTPETSPTGNIHGMPLAVLMGAGHPSLVDLFGFVPKLNPKYFAHIGARDVDAGERASVHGMGLNEHFLTMCDIDRRGMLSCVEQAIDIASQAPGGYAVTFDIDVIDPRFAPGSGTLVRGGASYREAHLALEIIAEHGGMRSFEIVEVNPLLDQSNITVELGCELILSAMGKTIL